MNNNHSTGQERYINKNSAAGAVGSRIYGQYTGLQTGSFINDTLSFANIKPSGTIRNIGVKGKLTRKA